MRQLPNYHHQNQREEIKELVGNMQSPAGHIRMNYPYNHRTMDQVNLGQHLPTSPSRNSQPSNQNINEDQDKGHNSSHASNSSLHTGQRIYTQLS